MWKKYIALFLFLCNVEFIWIQYIKEEGVQNGNSFHREVSCANFMKIQCPLMSGLCQAIIEKLKGTLLVIKHY